MTEINNRIEEVKKILAHYSSDAIGKELREKIEVETVKYMMRKGFMIKLPKSLSKTILALLQPKIEEVKARALEAGKLLGAKKERKGLSDLISMYLQEESDNRTYQVLTGIKKSLLFGKP